NHGFEIRKIPVLPSRRVAFRDPAAALGKARVADHAGINEEFAGGCAYGLRCRRRKHFRDALVSLAVIVCTYVKVRMAFTAVPANNFMRRVLSRPKRVARRAG